MKISLNWLREFVAWNGTPAALGELLVRTGIEVASVTTKGADFPQVVVAQILESTQHPNADRLSVCKVDDGSGHPRQIVCGAKNYKVGDKVPLALPGAVLPGDFKIKVGKLRGVESEGMLCSAKELNLAEDSAGLLILSPDAPIGKPISDLFPPETIFELEITPNRGDWLSHVGVAREVAAFSNETLNWTRPSAGATRGGGAIIGDARLCPFYSVRRIRNVKVGPSPQWLKQRLEAIGVRSINNVVDITNFVMMEMGQPLHAFDAAKVAGDIQVRTARAGEKFLALDGREYLLAEHHLVIADQAIALALAGVMGGEQSGVSDSTTEILLESALFQTTSIRRTGRELDLHSDSSYRFERGVDPAGILAASARATQLILEIAGGEAESDTLVAGELPVDGLQIELSTRRVQSLLGLDVPVAEIRQALIGLGLTLVQDGEESTTWRTPSHRLDLLREVDLIEEVTRVVGIEKITGRLAAAPAEPSKADAFYDFQMSVREQLAGQGFSEARTSTLISESMLWLQQPAKRLKNPLGEDQAFLRTSLLPGLLNAVERNIRHNARTIALFEVGRTFHAEGAEESSSLAIVLSGENEASNWRGEKSRQLDWHDAKGVLQSLTRRELTWTKIEAQAPLILAAEIRVGDQLLGLIGQVSPSAARAISAKAPVLVAELDLELLRTLAENREYREISKFPAVTRDIAVVCPVTLPYAEIEKVFRDAKEELLFSVEPFDIFNDPAGVKLPADRKSVAISLTFRTSGRTLTSEEVNISCERLKQELKTKLGVDFRE